MVGEGIPSLWGYQTCFVFCFNPNQEEMCRIEEEQSFEELKILRELVHERFHKQEELAEVRNPPWDNVLIPDALRVLPFPRAVIL